MTVGFSTGQAVKKQNLNPNDLVGLSLKQVFGNKEPIVKKNFLETFNGNETSFELFINNQYQLYKTVPLYDLNNEISRILVVAEDISEWKRTEKSLIAAKEKAEQSEKRFSAFNETTNEAIFFSKNGKCIDTNKAASKMFGFTYDELIDISITDIITPDSKELVQSNMLSGFEKPYDAIAIRKDGTRFYVELQGKMYYYNGENVGVTACRDITQRKLQEKLLCEAKERSEKSEIKLKEAQSIAHIGHWELDLVNNSLYWSDEIYRIFGCEPQEFGATYEAFLSYVHPEDKNLVNDSYNNHLKTKEPYFVTHRILLSNGDVKYVNEKCKSEFDEKSKPLRSIGTISDITEMMRTKIELEKHRNNLELLVKERTEELVATNDELHKQKVALEKTIVKLNRTQEKLIQSEKMASLGTIVAGVAHEINNPLNYIQSSVYGLESLISQNKLHEPSKNLEMILHAIKEGVKRTSEIVKALNKFSKNKPLLSQKIDIHDVIDKCIQQLCTKLGKKCVVEKDYCSDQFTFKGNVDSIHQAILNLLNNAIQAIENKGTVSISTSLLKEKNILQIKINDSGIGIPKDDLLKIFDPFFTTKDVGKGRGLGLSISYSAIKEHNGDIFVESELGKGSTFTIQLPVKRNNLLKME